jgi:hydroxymethylpyrimidine pyrophosphatase-like HAD family hydrolase
MRFHVLATDYDGTIAHHGTVDPPTLAALERVRASGRQVVLVTGRELPDLRQVFPALEVFDLVVAENGAMVYRPSTRQIRLLGERPPEAFVDLLKSRGVPVSVGQVIVATWQPHETAVLEAVRELGLELQVIFNKGAVMVLPSGINKAVGLRAALDELGLSVHNAVGVGDAENDHAFLSACECAVAVANALPALKDRADLVTRAPHGEGVQELAQMIIEADLEPVSVRLVRHALMLGTDESGDPIRLSPYAPPILVAGTSGGGKSTLATGLLEELAEHGYQFCIIDPEGDYRDLEGVAALGDADHPPGVTEILEVLAQPGRNISVNLVGVTMADRPAFFEGLMPRLQQMRARTGRPHWLVIDEAHHLLPLDRQPDAISLPRELHGLLLITVHPERLSPQILAEVDTVVAIGATPRETITAFATAVGIPAPEINPRPLVPGEALAWSRASQRLPMRFRVNPPRAERRRHVRKYAVGELGPDKSFYFRGPDGKLNLRAQNLQLFVQVADGVDEDTWLHHLRRGDYSRWFTDAIKDAELSAAVATIEQNAALSAAASRAAVRSEIERRYTAAA